MFRHKFDIETKDSKWRTLHLPNRKIYHKHEGLISVVDLAIKVG